MEPPTTRADPRQGRLALSLGDPAGIGAEVTLKALAALVRRDGPQAWSGSAGPLLVGCRRWLEESYRRLRVTAAEPVLDPSELEILDLPLEGPLDPGAGSAASGAASFAWLTAAAEQVLQGRCRSLVTAPIAKHAWQAAGHAYPGQTERLAELAGVAEASMLFTARSPWSGWRLNTLLATTHIPLAAVPGHLTPERVEAKLAVLLAFCRRFHNRPRLAVAGLNPHAGEAGQLGSEERDWLIPLLQRWQATHPEAELLGPLPPDTCWLEAGAAWWPRGADQPPSAPPAADGYLALYHDQGLIPVKLLAFDQAVNTSLGLPFLRTSPDHGTGFAIAGQGVARCASMAAALETALELG